MKVLAGILTHNPIFYGRMSLLERTYASLKTALGVEPLVFDNGSIDGAAGWCRSKPRHFVYEAPDSNHTPGRGMRVLIETLLREADQNMLIVVSDDDMLWRPQAGAMLQQFWGSGPDDVAILCAYLEPVWPWNAPREIIERGGVKVLCRDSSPAAAWTFRPSGYKLFGPLDDGWEFDTAACRKIAAASMKVAQVNLALHQGWGQSTQQNRAIEYAQSLGPEWNLEKPERGGSDMEIWYAIPTANRSRAEECFSAWKAQGFKTAALIDPGAPPPTNADLYIAPAAYPGYFAAVNQLVQHIDKTVEVKPDIIVTGGDDIFPDPKFTAAELAEQFYGRFPDGFGVMQPTGDTLAGTTEICGSPWLGRGWLDKAYCGRGPVFPGYLSFFGDEELKIVAESLGVLWQRPDVTQRHDHWSRQGGPAVQPYQSANQKNWNRDKELFFGRRSQKWPGSEPL